MKQQQLFPSENQNTARGLTISKAGKQQLTKNQQAFNKLTQRIEKLQKDIEKKQLQFDMALKIYGTELYPAQQKLLESRRKLIIVLWDIYKGNKLSKTDQRHLKNVLQFHMQELFEDTTAEPDEVIQQIFSELEGISYDKMVQQEKELRDAEMKELLKKMKVNMDGIDMEDEAAMAAKFAEAQQKIIEKEAENELREQKRQAKKKKTSKQEESEKMQKAVDEMKQKNISTIYKQLAKLFHPDLEQDEERKVEKGILMKELIAAYEAKNLHALLTLELKWIHKETDHLESLTEEKLKIYLEILREQASNLEYQKIMVAQQPPYALLFRLFGFSVQQYPVEIVKTEVKKFTQIVQEFDIEISDFESDMGLRHVKNMLRQWKKEEQQNNKEEELMNLFFGK